MCICLQVFGSSAWLQYSLEGRGGKEASLLDFKSGRSKRKHFAIKDVCFGLILTWRPHYSKKWKPNILVFFCLYFHCVTLGNFISLFLLKHSENFLKKHRFLHNDNISLLMRELWISSKRVFWKHSFTSPQNAKMGNEQIVCQDLFK